MYDIVYILAAWKALLRIDIENKSSSKIFCQTS